MTKQLHRCEVELVLRDFDLGKLDAASAESMNRQIETCSVCRQRLASTFARPSGQSRDVKHTQSRFVAPPELANHPDYEILDELGRNHTATIYLARNRLLDRLEALKVIDKHLLDRPRAMERVQQEVRMAAKLAHPNVVAIYGALRVGDLLVIASEYVAGEDFCRVVRQCGRLPVANAAFYVHQAALGLQHFDDCGMVHRCIRPGCLMLSISGKKHVVKISDFSLASASSKSKPRTRPRGSGQMLGVADYIAPEQTLDADNVDIRADIYCLGCTLYFLLSGGPPFQETSLYEILAAQHKCDPKSLNLVRTDVPPELSAVVAKMMAKDPAKRCQTPAEASRALVPFFKPTRPAPPDPFGRGAPAL